MTTKIFLISMSILFWVGCQKRSADDYQYYKPYQKKTAKVVAADTVKEILAVKSTLPQIVEKGVDLSDSYFIVVASYVVENYAIVQKKKLVDLGFKPEIFMTNDDGWYKIAVLSYKTLAEAESGLKILFESKTIAPDSYIVFRRNKS